MKSPQEIILSIQITQLVVETVTDGGHDACVASENGSEQRFSSQKFHFELQDHEGAPLNNSVYVLTIWC